MFIYWGEWRGLTVSVEDCHSNGRGIKSRSFPFLFSFFLQRRNVSLRKWAEKKRCEDSAGAGEMEERKTSRRFRNDAEWIGFESATRLNGQRRLWYDGEKNCLKWIYKLWINVVIHKKIKQACSHKKNKNIYLLLLHTSLRFYKSVFTL